MSLLVAQMCVLYKINKMTKKLINFGDVNISNENSILNVHLKFYEHSL